MSEPEFLISTRERRIRAICCRGYARRLAVYVWIYQQYREWTDEQAARMFCISLNDLYRLCLYDPPMTRDDVHTLWTLMGASIDSNHAELRLFLDLVWYQMEQHDATRSRT
jgi:hypothetical protein